MVTAVVNVATVMTVRVVTGDSARENFVFCKHFRTPQTSTPIEYLQYLYRVMMQLHRLLQFLRVFLLPMIRVPAIFNQNVMKTLYVVRFSALCVFFVLF